MKSDPEVERLTTVYREYRPPLAARWSPANPGNRAILTELDRRIGRLVNESGLLRTNDVKILDIGCGYGHFLETLRSLGAPAGALHGLDLLPERIDYARDHHPGVDFRTGRADEVPYPDGSFSLVLFFSLFTSIIDTGMRARVAAEARRVLRPGGAILWYDFRFDNPWNPHVRGMRRRDVADMFPGFALELDTITLLPPLARRLGPLTPVAYPLLAGVPALRTHHFGLLRPRAE
jgi:SAM-dependent methyltransferase